tara:strand:+ start:1482 stop:2498 length:1017 start_codon:yes stop_codon:yes gene_type:complete
MTSPDRILLESRSDSVGDSGNIGAREGGASEGQSQQITCSICLEDFNTDTNTMFTSCGHRFHYSCINIWLRSGHDSCPMCRTGIANNQQYYNRPLTFHDISGNLETILSNTEVDFVMYLVPQTINDTSRDEDRNMDSDRETNPQQNDVETMSVENEDVNDETMGIEIDFSDNSRNENENENENSRRELIDNLFSYITHNTYNNYNNYIRDVYNNINIDNRINTYLNNLSVDDMINIMRELDNVIPNSNLNPNNNGIDNRGISNNGITSNDSRTIITNTFNRYIANNRNVNNRDSNIRDSNIRNNVNRRRSWRNNLIMRHSITRNNNDNVNRRRFWSLS